MYSNRRHGCWHRSKPPFEPIQTQGTKALRIVIRVVSMLQMTGTSSGHRAAGYFDEKV